MEHTIEILKDRRKAIADIIHRHAMGRCLCRGYGGGFGGSNCHATQRRLGKVEKAYTLIIDDLEARPK